MGAVLPILWGVISWNTAFSLEASFGLLVLGSFLVIDGIVGGSGRRGKNGKVTFRIAWNSLSVKLLTLVSIGLTVTLVSININGYYLDVVSANFHLRSEINSQQSQMNELNQIIINLQDNNTSLEVEIQRLNGVIENLRIQESECQRKLRLFMVTVYGDSSYEELKFTTDGVVYTAEVRGGSYNVELRNDQIYSVQGIWTEYIWFIRWRPRSEDLGEFSLSSSEELFEKSWGET